MPTKALLDPPYPENLPVVKTCRECNSAYARDEEYLAAFLPAVISGSSQPSPKTFPVAAGILDRSPGLRKRLDQARQVQGHLWEEPRMMWMPEAKRVERVVIKNARGHLLFELDRQVVEPPSYVCVVPLCRMAGEQREEFERPSDPLSGWPEVGGKSMQRLLSSECGSGGWITVQHGVYRYAVDEEPKVRVVLREYLGAVVSWAEQ
ncbi:MAG: hypothetical protein OXH70_10210 [Acidobacteria bacterium]|nr:hypothetical protein [Acidobacteriota bacterium]